MASVHALDNPVQWSLIIHEQRIIFSNPMMNCFNEGVTFLTGDDDSTSSCLSWSGSNGEDEDANNGEISKSPGEGRHAFKEGGG